MPVRRSAAGGAGSNKRRKLVDSSKSPSPAQEAPSTQESQDELRQWLDDADGRDGPIFSTQLPKRKRGKKAKPPTSDTVKALRLNGKDHLEAKYTITPLPRWVQMQKYKKFTVQGETYTTGDCVFVKHTEGDHLHDAALDWKAQVHEVRALDETHVYLLVSWLEKPEDLPGGRKPYHGRTELVPSNKMDVIDAMTVNGGLQIAYWDEADDSPRSMPDSEKWYWRQTFDQDKKILSQLRLICKCEFPQNPDELIIRCGKKACATWLHASCLAEDALQRNEDRDQEKVQKPINLAPSQEKSDGAEDMGLNILFNNEETGDKSVTGSKSINMENEDKPTEADDRTALLETDKLIVEIKLVGAKQQPTIITTTKEDGRVTEEPVHCLVCDNIIT